MTVKTIVAKYLLAEGYDGLYHRDDCGCRVDDLMPCDGVGADCRPGVFQGQLREGWTIGPKGEEGKG